MPRASRTATKAEETEQAVNSTAETEKPQETANTNATEERFIYICLDIMYMSSLCKPKVKTAGTLLNKYYNDVLSLMRKPKED